jgi:hypothetical protein
MLKKIRFRDTTSTFPELSEEVERATLKQVCEVPKLIELFSLPPDCDHNSFEAYIRNRPGGGSLLFGEAAMVWLYLVGLDVRGADFTVAKFLNRILGLQFERQNALFQVFTTHLEDIVRQAKRAGTFDLGILEIKGPRPGAVRETCPPVVIYENRATAEVSLLHVLQSDKGVLWEETEHVCYVYYSSLMHQYTFYLTSIYGVLDASGALE